MKLSREKINRLSTIITDYMRKNPQVDLLENDSTIRLEVVKIMTRILEWDEIIDKKVKEKIGSQKKTVHEGSPEWVVLYQNYYSEELKSYSKYKK